MEKLKLYDIKWSSTTAGPSPDNNMRTELFFLGCNKAAIGCPCKGCFNQDLWKEARPVKEFIPSEVAKNIIRWARRKYITIVGGEPLDQINGLAELCKLLKEADFHIIVFTHYTLKDISLFASIRENGDSYVKLLHNIDILVDGEYDETQRIYDENAEDGFHDAIGSANQVIWDFKHWNEHYKEPVQGIAAGDLCGIYVNDSNDLSYITKEEIAFMNQNVMIG